MLKRIIPLLLAFLTSCTVGTSSFNPKHKPIFVSPGDTTLPQIIAWNDFGVYSDGAKEWLDVSSQRFNNPIIFSGHGGTHVEGAKKEWWVYPDPPRQPMSVEKLAETLSNMYPDRDIILITCNPGGFDLHVKRVWYAKGLIWTIPDDFANGSLWHEKIRGYDAVGSIWEFVSCNDTK